MVGILSISTLVWKFIFATSGAVRLGKLDVDKEQYLASELKIKSVPTVISFFEGRPISSFVGVPDEKKSPVTHVEFVLFLTAFFSSDTKISLMLLLMLWETRTPKPIWQQQNHCCKRVSCKKRQSCLVMCLSCMIVRMISMVLLRFLVWYSVS